MSTHQQTESVSPAYITRKKDGQSISQTVVEAVAEVSNRATIPDESPTEDDATMPLPPLYESIDPDALNRICQSATDETEMRVTFTYCGYELTVKNGDEIIVSAN